MTQSPPEPAHTTDWARTPWPVDRIAQAIGDPGSIVGRRLGPSWGKGNDGYAAEYETVARWSTRAVLAVLDEAAPTTDRAGQLRDQMAERWTPPVPPADLVREFPVELTPADVELRDALGHADATGWLPVGNRLSVHLADRALDRGLASPARNPGGYLVGIQLNGIADAWLAGGTA